MSRVWKGWGSPPATAWTYDSDSTWPPKEPDNIDLDLLARANRLLGYLRVRTSLECKQLILGKSGVELAVEITRSWFNAPNGLIPMPSPSDKIIGSHAFHVLGYDNNKRLFKFVNSWGISWGDEGCGYLPYDYFDKYVVECWDFLPYDVSLFKADTYAFPNEKFIVYRIIPSILHSCVHIAEVSNVNTGDYQGWAFGGEYENFFNVEELFILPQYRKKGLAKTLIDFLIKLATKLKKPLRFWVPYADSEEQNMDVIQHIAKTYGFKISNSPVRWADYLMAHEVPKGDLKRHRFSTPGMVLPGSNQIPFTSLGD